MAGQRKRKDKGDEKHEYGSGSILDNPDGSKTVQIYIYGKLVRRRAPDRPTAEIIKAELNEQKRAGIDIRRGSQPVEDFTDYWFNEVYLQRDRSERSQRHTLDMLELHILPVIARRPLNAVSHEELQHLLNDLRRRPKPKKPLSAQTVHHVYSVLKQVFGKAFQMHLIKYDPTVGLELPEIAREEKPALTVKQVRAVLDLVEGHPYALVFHLMATLGLRLGEALALRRTDFNSDFTEVHVRQAISYHTLKMGKPKRDSVRRVPVPPRLSACCQKQWESVKTRLHDPTPDFQEGGLLAPSETGTAIQPSNFEKAWHGYTERRMRKKGKIERYHPGFRELAGLPSDATLHGFRSFVATMLEDLDVSQRTIRHILGHGAKNVTERYIKRYLPTLRRGLEKLEAAMWADQDKKEKEETG